MNLVNTLEHANCTVNVYVDPEPLGSRKDYENATIMVHWHRRYDLGDQRVDYCSSEDLEKQYENDSILCIKPLYLYDHSGLSLSTTPFSCSFDSGQVGWVFITKSKAEMMGFIGYNDNKLQAIIDSEVKVHDDYLNGRVFGYQVVFDGEVIDSCWGFIGDAEECADEGKRTAAAYKK